MKNVKFKLIVCSASVIFTLLGCELVIRCFKLVPELFNYRVWGDLEFVANPLICYKLKQNKLGGELNSEGFRDREFVIKKNRDEIRIIMLGDSITAGSGVSVKKRFSDRLEDLLNRKSLSFGSKIKYNVMNFGVGGYNIVSETEIFKVYCLKYHPDIVILNYFWNDNNKYSWDLWRFLNESDFPFIQKKMVYEYYLNPSKLRLKRLFFHSQLFVFCWARIESLTGQLGRANSLKLGDYKEDIIFKKVSELKDLGKRFGFKLFICMHPILDYDGNKPFSNYASTKNSAKKLNVPCIDLLPFYNDVSKDPRVFLLSNRRNDTYHPNALGHDLVARVLAEVLEKEGFIKF